MGTLRRLLGVRPVLGRAPFPAQNGFSAQGAGGLSDSAGLDRRRGVLPDRPADRRPGLVSRRGIRLFHPHAVHPIHRRDGHSARQPVFSAGSCGAAPVSLLLAAALQPGDPRRQPHRERAPCVDRRRCVVRHRPDGHCGAVPTALRLPWTGQLSAPGHHGHTAVGGRRPGYSAHRPALGFAGYRRAWRAAEHGMVERAGGRFRVQHAVGEPLSMRIDRLPDGLSAAVACAPALRLGPAPRVCSACRAGPGIGRRRLHLGGVRVRRVSRRLDPRRVGARPAAGRHRCDFRGSISAGADSAVRRFAARPGNRRPYVTGVGAAVLPPGLPLYGAVRGTRLDSSDGQCFGPAAQLFPGAWTVFRHRPALVEEAPRRRSGACRAQKPPPP